jgi:hypothetical protein
MLGMLHLVPKAVGLEIEYGIGHRLARDGERPYTRMLLSAEHSDGRAIRAFVGARAWEASGAASSWQANRDWAHIGLTRFRTIQVSPKDLAVLPRQLKRAVSWHSGFRRGSPCST